MLISFVFPISDIRDFVEGAPNRLKLPDWPDAYPPLNKYVRAFGPVQRRPKGGAKQIGENHVCDAHSAIRFTHLSSLTFDSTSQPVYFIPRYRRFFFDGY